MTLGYSMRVDDLQNKKVVIWGTGKEGVATATWIVSTFPEQPFCFVDDGDGPEDIEIAFTKVPVFRKDASAKALAEADVIIKSPGVSLYHPSLEKEMERGAVVTSLLNLWLAEERQGRVIGITGTKGKSTTSTLLGHVLTKLGKRAVVLGNIGIPVSACTEVYEYYIVEVSSYQAANFSETCGIGVLTSLFPEHLDWHRSIEAYYKDKANLLAHSTLRLIDDEAYETLQEHNITVDGALRFNMSGNFHFVEDLVCNGAEPIGSLENAYLLRRHNRHNVCAVLQVVHALGLDPKEALHGMGDYRGLPHREYELGEKEGILYVDDSISTTPQSAIAAMEAYAGRALTLIAGGFDRGIDYAPLVNYVAEKKIHAVVCLGQSGERIFAALKEKGLEAIRLVGTMEEAVREAKALTRKGGVILLSPAAPSYGLFKDFVERAECFSKESGF